MVLPRRRKAVENDDDLLEFMKIIKDYHHIHGHLPTLQTFASEIGYSVSMSQNIMNMIEERGFIVPGRNKQATEKMRGYPMIGSVKAGPPDNIFAMETEEFIDIEKELVDDPAHTFVVQVSGDSLIDVGIHDGSYVTIQHDPSPQIGNLIYALVDGEYTLKFYHLTNGRAELHPGNAKHEPITTYETLDIIGVCIGYFSRVPKG